MLKLPKKFKIFIAKKKIILFLLLFLIVLGVGGYLTRSWFVAAIVNNRPITRFELDRELEKQAGRQVLENKITGILILQEAKKQKIEVSPAEVDDKIKDIENQVSAQGQNLDNLLQLQGQTKDDLKKQIMIQSTIEKILAKNIQVSDEEAKTYFEKNKGSYPKDTTFESQKEALKSELFQKKLGEQFQSWIAGLKQQAKIYYFLNF